ncbi:hypothetical protein [Paenibacillus sp. NEAU-GSW1]|uniref:hypothetical protein n=1 Tax=Paenibacillus sp. NEAU-GSW1 TaxID=2682486 RepID=UPI0012E2BB6C|nr:hypothetical protein [Paenibacillus sp. NEAU-GSW1]MUT66046.1 hypothetical protein [Paenibacillus sp. NEAU-GSW1]
MNDTIRQIKEALEKATPYPWSFQKIEGDEFDEGAFVAKNDETICSFGSSEQFYPTSGEAPNKHDAHLIANAPTWLQWAVEELEKAQTLAEDYSDRYLDAIRTLNETRDEHKAMKEALEWIEECGVDYQSNNKARSVLSSLKEESE